jgi:hypothetical protein
MEKMHVNEHLKELYCMSSAKVLGGFLTNSCEALLHPSFEHEENIERVVTVTFEEKNSSSSSSPQWQLQIVDNGVGMTSKQLQKSSDMGGRAWEDNEDAYNNPCKVGQFGVYGTGKVGSYSIVDMEGKDEEIKCIMETKCLQGEVWQKKQKVKGGTLEYKWEKIKNPTMVFGEHGTGLKITIPDKPKNILCEEEELQTVAEWFSLLLLGGEMLPLELAKVVFPNKHLPKIKMVIKGVDIRGQKNEVENFCHALRDLKPQNSHVFEWRESKDIHGFLFVGYFDHTCIKNIPSYKGRKWVVFMNGICLIDEDLNGFKFDEPPEGLKFEGNEGFNRIRGIIFMNNKRINFNQEKTKVHDNCRGEFLKMLDGKKREISKMVKKKGKIDTFQFFQDQIGEATFKGNQKTTFYRSYEGPCGQTSGKKYKSMVVDDIINFQEAIYRICHFREVVTTEDDTTTTTPKTSSTMEMDVLDLVLGVEKMIALDAQAIKEHWPNNSKEAKMAIKTYQGRVASRKLQIHVEGENDDRSRSNSSNDSNDNDDNNKTPVARKGPGKEKKTTRSRRNVSNTRNKRRKKRVPSRRAVSGEDEDNGDRQHNVENDAPSSQVNVPVSQSTMTIDSGPASSSSSDPAQSPTSTTSQKRLREVDSELDSSPKRAKGIGHTETGTDTNDMDEESKEGERDKGKESKNEYETLHEDIHGGFEKIQQDVQNGEFRENWKYLGENKRESFTVLQVLQVTVVV